MAGVGTTPFGALISTAHEQLQAVAGRTLTPSEITVDIWTPVFALMGPLHQQTSDEARARRQGSAEVERQLPLHMG